MVAVCLPSDALSQQLLSYLGFSYLGRGVSLHSCSSKMLPLSKRLLKIFNKAITIAAKSLQSCPTLCNPINGRPPSSPVPGILQARTLEWVAISFSNVWKWKVKVKSLSSVRPLATPWTAAYQAPPSMGFSRQEYWSGVPWPSLMNRHSPCQWNYHEWCMSFHYWTFNLPVN